MQTIKIGRHVGLKRFIAIGALTLLTAITPSFAIDLSKLPDPLDKGVIRVWPADRQPGQNNRAGAGDTVIVELRNLDGWLMEKLDYGRMTESADVRGAPPAVRSLINGHAFRFAVAAAVWMEDYERDELEKNQPKPNDTKELTDLRNFYISKKSILNQFPPPQLNETDPQKIKELLESFRIAKLFLFNLTNSVKKDLVLCINRIALSGVKPENAGDPAVPKTIRPPGNPAEDTYHWLRFTLRRDANNESDWDLLLAQPSFSIQSMVTLRFTAGSDTYDLPTAVEPDSVDPRCRFVLAGMSYLSFWSALGVLLFCIIVFWRYAGTTDLVRDADGALRADGRRPFSLAKSQMAMWFFLILGSFALLWAATGKLTTLNDTCLWLIGIGSGTALGAAVISVGRDPEQKEQYPAMFGYKLADKEIEKGLENKIAEAATKLAQLPATATEVERAEARAAVEALQNQLIDFKLMPARGWRRVMEDWLSESGSNGTWSFHRFQMLGWTLILGLIFFLEVASKRIIPEFNTQLLALMGISAGTYIGFKLPAQKEIERKNKSDA